MTGLAQVFRFTLRHAALGVVATVLAACPADTEDSQTQHRAHQDVDTNISTDANGADVTPADTTPTADTYSNDLVDSVQYSDTVPEMDITPDTDSKVDQSISDSTADQEITSASDSAESETIANPVDVITVSDDGSAADTMIAPEDSVSSDTQLPPTPPKQEPSGWRSTQYPINWTPETTDAQGRFVHDFSYAGYHRGADPIPTTVAGPMVLVTEPPYNADPLGVKDSTQAIQSAIDDVGKQGGGTVVLPEGTFRVKLPSTSSPAALLINYSGVLLKGKGRDKTFVVNDDYVMRNKAVIRIAPEKNASWSSSNGPSVNLATDAPNRASKITVESTDSFAVGQWVIVRFDATEAWVEDHNMTGLWTDKILGGQRFLRQIIGIEDKTLTLDIPLRYPVKVADGGRVYPPKPQLSEIGLQDFSIGMREHPGKTGWGDNDYNTEGKSAYDVHGADAIRFNYVRDSWVLRVGSYRPQVNNGQYHILSDGIVLAMSRSISVIDSSMSYPQYEGGGGNGYGFVLQGSDNLLMGCSSVHTRHAYSFKKMIAHGNAIVRCSSSYSRLATDFHMHLSMANLLDSMSFEADFVDATYRPWGTAHGYTTTQTMIWNTRSLLPYKTNTYVVDSRQFDWGLVVGTQGVASGIKTTPLVDTKDTSPQDFSEGEGAGGTLVPASLYDDQMYRRFNEGQPKPTKVTTSALLSIADSTVRSGSYSDQNYGTDDKLKIKDSGKDYTRHSFMKFDLNNIERPVKKATLRIYGGVTDDGGDTTELWVDGVHNNAWQEGKITWDSQPTEITTISKTPVNKTKSWHVMDVTSFVQWKQNDGGIVSFRLSQNLETKGLLVTLNSRENLNKPPELELVLGPQVQWNPTTVSGDEADSGTAAKHVLDNDLSTRWSNDDFGGQITIDLGESKPTTSAGIAFHKGNERIGYFEVRISSDSINWQTVISGQSSGQTLGKELYRWPTADARYIQVVGFGNSKNAWNSITELSVHVQ